MRRFAGRLQQQDLMADTGGIPSALIPIAAFSMLLVGAALLSYALRWRTA